MTTIETAPQAPTQPSFRLPRVMAAGGTLFVLIVVAQNLLRGATAPTNDASPAAVLEHYSNDVGMAVLLSSLFVIGGISLFGFLAAVARRVFAAGFSLWGAVGLLGATLVAALFSTVVALEAALVGAAGRDNPDLGTVDALWLAHNAVFAVLGLGLGGALLGLGRACAEEGLTPGFFRWLAPAGAVLLCLGAMPTPVIADGSVMPARVPTMLGFVVWLGFMVCTSVTMVRQAD
jgi:hypothetical protein